MVMAQTLFIELQRRQPRAIIDVLAPDWSRPLLERMPEVNRAVPMPVGHGELRLGARRRLAKALKEEGYDQAIVLPNSLKSALVPLLAGIPQRTGWLGEMRYGLLNDWRKLDKERYPLMVERFVALAGAPDEPLPRKIARPALRIDPTNLEQALTHFNLHTEYGRVLALCPGAEFGEAKRWPAPAYAAVATHYMEQGWQTWIFGSAKDRPVADELRDAIPEKLRGDCRILAGDTSLAQAVDLLSVADAVVSNDSGLMHIAAALDRTLAVVYGSTSPKFTPPLASAVEILSLNLECSPCFQRTCPLEHTNCLKQLPPKMVTEALDRLLRDAPADARTGR